MVEITPVELRMFERILCVLGGAISIYFGYKLFANATLRQDAAGKFKASAIEFSVAKVGPGVFFAFFGCFVLYSSLVTQVNFAPLDPAAETRASRPEIAQLSELVKQLPATDRAKAEKIIARIQTQQPVFFGWNPDYNAVAAHKPGGNVLDSIMPLYGQRSQPRG